MAPLDTGVEIDRVPAAATHLDAADIARSGSADLLAALERRVGGVSLSLAQGSSFQPNVLYRGFEASPLQGNAQGIAVYVDGARFNQPFGDTMDWDLVPDIAISQADLVSSNPAFGLNALGGALNVQLKTALGAEGASVEVSGGSFGRTSLAAEAGGQVGPLAFYGAVSALDEYGWRDFSPSRQRRGYLDLGWKQDRLDLHLSLLSANNDLTGNGASPVELLATDRAAVFTHPDSTHNDFDRLLLGGDWRPDDRWTIRLRAYAGHLDRKTENGDAAEVAPCAEDADVLCSTETDATLTDDARDPIPNFVTDSPYVDAFPVFAEGGPYAFLNASRTRTTSSGVSIQAIGTESLLGAPHRLSAGVSFDGARTRFSAGTRVGELTLDRGFEGPGIAVDQPDASVTAVSVNVRTENWGVFASDAITLTPDLTLTLTGRQNIADVRLRDQLGIALDGDHVFRRFNPAAGLTWRVQDGISVYGGYAETNRAPTPAELSCADPESPCSLANFFVADPPLRQVIARTWEAGLRGHTRAMATVDLDWRLGAYRTAVNDDIQLVASGVAGRGYFTNVGSTRREGIEASIVGRTGGFDLFAEYAFTQATYRTAFDLNAGANPAFEDEDDIMTVEVGDRRPGIPEHILKMGADLALLPSFSIGVDGVWSSGRYLFGDEANLNPRSSDYFVANAHAISRLGEHTEIFLQVRNLFDTDYATFGAFAPIDVVPIVGLPDISDPRSLSPGAPRAVFVGLRLKQ
ncbi:MAG: TonB-dependent receptor [Hyphomonadaceae bacterium]